MNIEITINGKRITREVSSNQRLLDFLREDLGLKGTKYGCDQGECGACSIILNNKIVTSCIILMAQIPENSTVLTIEGTNSILQLIQEKFKEFGAAQCGACTPGMIMAATSLLHLNPNANQEEIEEGLCGVLCRCTGYTKIYDAVKEAQKQL
ncbi:MAG: (2Fe-2S)-binding protein [Candidatus Hodarchaeales archaeon]|jgi:carbon-monoxide dehydrogenase small subunit